MSKLLCAKCGEEGNSIRIVADDSEFSSVLHSILCGDCYVSLLDTIWDMITEDGK